MAVYAPDGLILQSNLTGLLTDIDEDPDSADGLWLTANSDNANSDVAVSFPTPAGTPSTGAGLQEFRVRYRVTVNGSSVTFNAYLRENGTRINGGTAIDTWASTATDPGAVRSITWDASLLGTSDGSLVELEIEAVKSGGSPANRTTGEFGAFEWVTAESAAVNVAPTAGSLALTGAQPVILTPVTVNPVAASLALTGTQPTVDVASPIVVNPVAASLALTGETPVILNPVTVNPVAASLALTGAQPTTLTPIVVNPVATSLTLTGQQPFVALDVTALPTAGILTLTGEQPIVVAYDASTIRRRSRRIVGFG